MAVVEYDEQAGSADVEALGEVQQHLAVAVGLVLPIDAARAGAVAAPAVLLDIEERLVGARHQPRIGEGGGFELDELGAPARERPAAHMHPVGDGRYLVGHHAVRRGPRGVIRRPWRGGDEKCSRHARERAQADAARSVQSLETHSVSCG